MTWRIIAGTIFVLTMLYVWDVASHVRDCSWRWPNVEQDYRCAMAPTWVWGVFK